MSAAVLAAVLAGAGVYLLFQRGLVRVTFGFILLGHAVNVVLLAAGGMDRRDPPLLGEGSADQAADPLPQAFALTAIVIAFGITVYLLAIAGSGGDPDGPAVDDDFPAGKEDAPEAAALPEPGTSTPDDPLGTTPTGAQPTGPTTRREDA